MGSLREIAAEFPDRCGRRFTEMGEKVGPSREILQMTGGADALQEEQFLGMYLAFYQTIFFAGKSNFNHLSPFYLMRDS